VRERGYQEETIALVLAPQAPVAEGIASLALEMGFGDEAYATAAAALEPLGVTYDHETAAAIHVAQETIGMLPVNGRLPPPRARRVPRCRPRLPARVEPPVAREGRPHAGVHRGSDVAELHQHLHGRVRLCRAYVAGDPARFVALLTEQLTPPDLVLAASATAGA
jgi:hypothetical protein